MRRVLKLAVFALGVTLSSGAIAAPITDDIWGTEGSIGSAYMGRYTIETYHFSGTEGTAGAFRGSISFRPIFDPNMLAFGFSIRSKTVNFDSPMGTGRATGPITCNEIDCYIERVSVVSNAVGINNGKYNEAFTVGNNGHPVGYQTQHSNFFNEAPTDGTLFKLVMDSGNPDHSYTFTGTFTSSISPVPLPASAPLFGAALLGLAGFGYAAKRKKAAPVN